jgi:hypothetical protein
MRVRRSEVRGTVFDTDADKKQPNERSALVAGISYGVRWNAIFPGVPATVPRSLPNSLDLSLHPALSKQLMEAAHTGDVESGNNGNQQWQQTVGGTEIDFCYDAIELANGTIIAVGESSSNNQDITVNKGFSDLLIIKLK